MRLNAFIAQSTGISRRKADELIKAGRVSIDGKNAGLGAQVIPTNVIKLDDHTLSHNAKRVLVLLNKPAGYVVSRSGQGSKTVYELLPKEYAALKPIGRLDKDSTGLLLMTNDGQLSQSLTHPSQSKLKVYLVSLDKSLTTIDEKIIIKGVDLEDGVSRLELSSFSSDRKTMTVKMKEGRNRQIRRTFKYLGYEVRKLHRISFGDYQINGLESGKFIKL